MPYDKKTNHNFYISLPFCCFCLQKKLYMDV